MLTRLALPAIALILTACGGGGEVGTPEAPATQAPAVAFDINDRAALLARGASRYKLCQACHTLGNGERHKVGPNLWEIFGDEAGTRDGFNSSKAMMASEIIWDDDTLDAYLEDPRGYIPGNRMSFIGVRKPEDRKAIIAYLRAETGG